MEKLKIVFEIEGKINQILSERQDELARLAGLMAEEDAAIAEANKAMDKATAEGNLPAYQKAKAERTAAADGKEMHEARKAALEEKPLLSEAEYKKAYADICAEIAGIDGSAKKELAALSVKMNACADALQEAINKANEVLHRLQHDIFRDADRTRNPKTGEVMPLMYEEAHVNPECLSTVKWGRAGVESMNYQKYTGNRILLSANSQLLAERKRMQEQNKAPEQEIRYDDPILKSEMRELVRDIRAVPGRDY